MEDGCSSSETDENQSGSQQERLELSISALHDSLDIPWKKLSPEAPSISANGH